MAFESLSNLFIRALKNVIVCVVLGALMIEQSFLSYGEPVPHWVTSIIITGCLLMLGRFFDKFMKAQIPFGVALLDRIFNCIFNRPKTSRPLT